jgi:outer membrane receptor protein involved in Fe transport
MKRFYILFAIIFSFITAKAQFGVGGGGGSTTVGKISGIVIDSVTKKPMDYTTISLFRSGGKAPITGVVTDEKGRFHLDNLHPGSYKVTISFMGYTTKNIDPVVTTNSKPDNNLGTILFSPTARALKEVVVTGQAALVENHIDKVVYNAEKDVTAAGGSATDILQKVPLVSVDINGNVSLRGDANVRVLINGKPSGATSASLADVLKGIPADQIKSVEVITSPSAKYDAEGSAGIINIITKQKNISGVSGSISGGVGTRQNNGNMNFNYNKNRFSLTLNAGGNASWPQTTLTDFTQAIYNDSTKTTSLQETKGSSRLTRHAVIGSASANYEFNSYNSVHTSFRLTNIEFNTDGTSQTISNTSAPYSSATTTHAVPANGFDWNIDYTHKFKKEGEELDFSTQWSHSTGVTDYTNIYTPEVFKNIQNNINGVNDEYTLQTDYTLPINKKFKLETGGKYIIRRLNSTNDLYNQVGSEFIFDPINSSLYNYDQDVAAGYAVVTINLPKDYSILAGFRDEYTSIHGDPKSQSQQDLLPFDNYYNTLVPSLTLQKKLTATQTLKLGYSKRISRPSLQYLNPFINKSNVLAQTVGDPKLQPEVSQTIELGYNTYIKTSIVNFSVYYKRTTGLIEGIASPIHVMINDTTTKSGTLTTYQNVGTNNSFGGSFFGSVTPFKILTILGNINAYTYNANPSGQFQHDQSQTGTYILYGGFLRATLTLPHDIIAEAFGFGSSPRHTIQGTNSSFSIFGVGARKQFAKKKYSLGINVIQPFSEYKNFNTDLSSPGFVQKSNFQLPFRSFGLTFSYNFGKLSFSNPQQQKKGINNDDMKQGDQGVGGGGGQPTGGGR